jgi:uncharacterized protein (TIGR02453 family)
MAFFSEDYYRFFKELEANNHKEWFDLNRKRYEENIKKPFKNFVEHLISKVHEIDPEVNLLAKNSIMRINRDIRFSKDKTPYKLHCAALISRGGKKDLSTPGQFFSIGLSGLEVYGGLYQPTKTELYNLRQHISYNLEAFENLINEKKFKELFGELKGEKNKVIPSEFKEDAARQKLIFNKSFYYHKVFDQAVITKDNLDEIWMECFLAGKALNEFLYQGSQG